jgi:superfamily I DNA and/or RNA helicase
MNETDIQLIQGPPGTGKTHTINGILSMLYFSKKKVLVCAPSNTAVNEIIHRLDKNKFFDGGKKDHPEGKLVRVEGLGYDSPENIQ